MTDTAPPARRSRLRLLWAATVLVAVLALAATYASRRQIAGQALTGWLRERGLASQVEVLAFGPAGFTGRMQVGDPAHPDFAAERMQVAYRLTPLGLQVTSVRLRAPVLRARLRGGTLSFGALDPVIADFLRRPAPPTQPTIRIEQGVLLLVTDYGPVRLGGDVAMDKGRLTALTAGSTPVRLAGPGLAAELGAGSLRVKTAGEKVLAAIDLPVAAASVAGVAVRDGRLQASLTATYPDLKRRRLDGPVSLRASFPALAISVGGRSLSAARIDAGFDGTIGGWVGTATAAGAGSLDLRAAGADLGGAGAELIKVAARAADLRWSRAGGEVASARLTLQVGVGGVRAGRFAASQLHGDLQGPVAWRNGAATVQLAGAAAGRGVYSGLGAPLRTDSRELAAVKRAARSFRVSAPGLGITAQRGAWSLALRQPLRLVSDTGGTASVSARGGAPVMGSAGGALRLDVGGGGLPALAADVARLRLTPGGLVAAGQVKAAASAGPVDDGALQASGELRLAGAGLSFTADRCAGLRARRLRMGTNGLEGLSGRLCPVGGPLFSLAQGDWRLKGRIEAGAVEAPFAQLAVTDAVAGLDLRGRGAALGGTVTVSRARVTDQAPSRRFNPLALAGQVQVANQLWTADLAAALPGGPKLARAVLRHDGRSGRGGIEIDTGTLAFAPGGLQPAQISPLAAAVGAPVEGQARFAGRFDWTAAGMTSGGELSVRSMDFQSPAGAVAGLSGDIVFTSLAPLMAAPGQALRAASLAAIAPVTDISATLAIDGAALTITGGAAKVGGGRVAVETLEIPFAADRPIRGVLGFEGVQLHDLVEASPFGDRVDLEAKVSGRVPFETRNGAVHVQSGELRAVEPGRLSIRRTALSTVAADGAATPVTAQNPDTFTDFAYQAMENLAFQTLDAKIDSLPQGRLGVLFHIIGKHDPPTRQRIRLSVADLISRRFMNRSLPLPSGTGVNLTLDTTLNLDDLLKDFAEYQRLRGSGPVQP